MIIWYLVKIKRSMYVNIGTGLANYLYSTITYHIFFSLALQLAIQFTRRVIDAFWTETNRTNRMFNKMVKVFDRAASSAIQKSDEIEAMWHSTPESQPLNNCKNWIFTSHLIRMYFWISLFSWNFSINIFFGFFYLNCENRMNKSSPMCMIINMQGACCRRQKKLSKHFE